MLIARAASKIEGIITSSTTLVGSVTLLVFTLAVLVFAWGIVRLIAAAGNTEKIKQAKGIIWWGIIGMFVLASIAGIIYYLQKQFGIDSILTIPAPQFQPQ